MRLRAVTYIRVSTDEEDQQTSLVNQDKDSRQAILDNGWSFVRKYVDENRSGTTTKRRDDYNRLFSDLEGDTFDIVVVKDQVRLMRNTREWYIFIDKLIQNKKQLYFYLERKFYSADDALLTGIRAILAEDYSRTLSKNINNAHRTRQKSGSNVVLTSSTWGYDKIDKKVVVNEAEAKMVHRMYEIAYYQNYGCRTIAKMIESEGYRNRKGGRLSETVIRRILRNPLYKGTAVMNCKHFDFETKQTTWNPQKDWIYHENMVPAIVEEWLWDGVQKNIDARSDQFFGENKKSIGVKRNYYPYSSKFVCGECGYTYHRAVRKLSKSKGVYWCCQNYLSRGRRSKNSRTPHGKTEEKFSLKGSGCDNIHLKETDMEELCYRISKKFYEKSNEDLVKDVMKILNQALSQKGDIAEREFLLQKNIHKITADREMLLDRYLEGVIAEDIYKVKEKKLIESLHSAQEELNQIEQLKAAPDAVEQRLKQLKEEVAQITDRQLGIKNILSHILKVEVFPERLLVTFDIFPPLEVVIHQISYRRREFIIP